MAETKKKKSTEGRLFKYMGTSHVRRIDKGDTFGGRYPDGLEDTLQWDVDDGHLISSEDHPDVAPELWDLLATEADIEEVTGRKVMPTSQAESLWRGQGQQDNPYLVAPTAVAGDTENPVGSGAGGATGTTGGSGTGVSAGSGTGVTGDASTS